MSKRSDNNNGADKGKGQVLPSKLSKEEQFQQNERRKQKVMAIMGFGAFGLLVGLLWGANHMIAVVHDSCPLSQAAQVGYLVATNTPDWMRGLVSGAIGGCCGGGFGAALFLKA